MSTPPRLQQQPLSLATTNLEQGHKQDILMLQRLSKVLLIYLLSPVVFIARRRWHRAAGPLWQAKERWERINSSALHSLFWYVPPPVELKTPSTFFYRKAGNLEWAGQYPILPEVVLTPERIHELLPFLAHHLAYYNTEKPKLPVFSRFPDCVPLAGLLLLTGNFLWLPVKCKQGIEQGEHQSDITLQRAHVHEADQFAVWLGQGSALEHQLRRIEEVLKRQGKVDRNIPTLVERIGHLEILNHQEREQMRKLGRVPSFQEEMF